MRRRDEEKRQREAEEERRKEEELRRRAAEEERRRRDEEASKRAAEHVARLEAASGEGARPKGKAKAEVLAEDGEEPKRADEQMLENLRRVAELTGGVVVSLQFLRRLTMRSASVRWRRYVVRGNVKNVPRAVQRNL